MPRLCNTADSCRHRFPFPLPASYALVMQNNHNSFFSWCLYELKHRQLFQVLLWNVQEVVNPIPTVCTGEESGTDPGLCNTAQPCCNSLSCACSDHCSVTAPSNSPGFLKPEEQNLCQDHFFSRQGRQTMSPTLWSFKLTDLKNDLNLSSTYCLC